MKTYGFLIPPTNQLDVQLCIQYLISCNEEKLKAYADTYNNNALIHNIRKILARHDYSFVKDHTVIENLLSMFSDRFSDYTGVGAFLSILIFCHTNLVTTCTVDVHGNPCIVLQNGYNTKTENILAAWLLPFANLIGATDTIQGIEVESVRFRENL